eukprot:scaffold847_cov385-Prasinococcus_capsulatus_cf.AAC.16
MAYDVRACGGSVFYDYIDSLDVKFDRVASGHYARVESSHADGTATREVRLLLSRDEHKDQTYFLSQLKQEQLARCCFPLGGLSKQTVRGVAEEAGLATARRKDSQGICFLGKVKFSEFVAEHLGENPGKIVEYESGDVLGQHKGVWFHTIGQRRGLELSGGPWYVVSKDLEKNLVYISKDYYAMDKRRDQFGVGRLNWINEGLTPTGTTRLMCKVRHGPQLYRCSLTVLDSPSETEGDLVNCTRALVRLDEDDQGLAAGQYCAFYQNGICLGSGMITETG